MTRRRRHRVSARGSSSPRPACSRCRTSPTCPGATTSAASSTTPGGGRRRRSTSPASASRSSAPARAACRSSRPSLDEVASLTVYQRTANWCTPLNNAPITADEQAQLRADFEAIRETLNTSLSGFLHPAHDRAAFDDSDDERRAFFEKMWNSPGFSKLTSNYTDLLFDEAANAEWCEFIAEKIRGIVDDPETAEQLIPKDHRFGEKRPPFVTGYYEAFNDPNVSLVDLRADADRAHDRDAGSRPPTACASSTSSCGRPASTSAPARCTRMGIRGRDGLALDGPLGRRPDDVPRRPDHAASRTSSSPADRTPRPATTRGTTATRSTSSPTRSSTRATTATTRSRSTAEAEERWTRDGRPGRRGDRRSARAATTSASNIPGKPRRVPAELRRPPEALQGDRADVVDNDYAAFRAVDAASSDRRDRVSGEPTIPGSRSGGAVSRKRLRSCSRSHVASSCRYHISPSGTPSLNRQRWWIGSSECRPSASRSAAEHPLDRVVVGDERRDLRVGDPLEQRLVARVEVRAHPVDLHRVRVAVPLEDLGREAGVEQQHVAGLHDDVVGRHDLLERRAVRPPRHSWPRWCARSTSTPRPCTPWNAMCSSPRWCAKQRVLAAVAARRRRCGPTRSTPAR